MLSHCQARFWIPKVMAVSFGSRHWTKRLGSEVGALGMRYCLVLGKAQVSVRCVLCLKGRKSNLDNSSNRNGKPYHTFGHSSPCNKMTVLQISFLYFGQLGQITWLQSHQSTSNHTLALNWPYTACISNNQAQIWVVSDLEWRNQFKNLRRWVENFWPCTHCWGIQAAAGATTIWVR